MRRRLSNEIELSTFLFEPLRRVQVQQGERGHMLFGDGSYRKQCVQLVSSAILRVDEEAPVSTTNPDSRLILGRRVKNECPCSADKITQWRVFSCHLFGSLGYFGGEKLPFKV